MRRWPLRLWDWLCGRSPMVLASRIEWSASRERTGR